MGKGVVKKYSREYYRTLKNGERKKYTTRQIQITIPKNEDIYENGEEVLIIPHDEIENIKHLESRLEDVEIANYLYLEEVKTLEHYIDEQDPSEYEKIIEELKEALHQKDDEINKLENDSRDSLAIIKEEHDSIKLKHSRLIEENENLKSKYVNIKIENENLKSKYSNIKEENKNLKSKCFTLKETHENIKSSYDQISTKYNQLKQENLNTKTSYAEMYDANESLEKDYDDLRSDYNHLVDRYNELEEELYNLKTTKNRDAYIAGKVKEFILKNNY